MIPWHCDALLPAPDRQASLAYRRFWRLFQAREIRYPYACEIVAFGRTVAHDPALAQIFHWGQSAREQFNVLKDYLKDDETVAEMHHQNMGAIDQETGIAMFKAMKDGGWKAGRVSPVIRMAILDLRDRGLSRAKIGRILGMGARQVETTIAPVKAKPAPGLAGAGLVAE